MRILNPFRAGLFAGLGVLVAIAIGGAVTSLSTVLTYVGTALFLALGLDPLVNWLESRKVPRWAAILIVLVAFFGILTGLVFAIIPVVTDEVTKATVAIPVLWARVMTPSGDIAMWIQSNLPWLKFDDLSTQALNWLTTLDFSKIGLGVLNIGIGAATGVTGTIIVIILTIYFTASTRGLKRALYRLVPASKRPVFIDLAEQIMVSVGRFVIGQGTLGIANGLLSTLFLGVIFPYVFHLPVDYWALLAFLALIGSMIPLVGTLAASLLNALLVLFFDGGGSALGVLIYYLVYMQVEAYVLSPRIMSQAVRVPGAVVVIAALAGGTLLGLLGALIAIPTAAAIILIINKVYVPRQENA